MGESKVPSVQPLQSHAWFPPQADNALCDRCNLSRREAAMLGFSEHCPGDGHTPMVRDGKTTIPVQVSQQLMAEKDDPFKVTRALLRELRVYSENGWKWSMLARVTEALEELENALKTQTSPTTIAVQQPVSPKKAVVHLFEILTQAATATPPWTTVLQFTQGVAEPFTLPKKVVGSLIGQRLRYSQLGCHDGYSFMQWNGMRWYPSDLNLSNKVGEAFQIATHLNNALRGGL